MAAVIAESEARLEAVKREQSDQREQAESDLASMSMAVDMRHAAVNKLADRLAKEEERLRKWSEEVDDQLAARCARKGGRAGRVFLSLFSSFLCFYTVWSDA